MHGPAAKQVQVNVKHGLAGISVRIHDQPEAFAIYAFVFCDLCCGPDKMADEGAIFL